MVKKSFNVAAPAVARPSAPKNDASQTTFEATDPSTAIAVEISPHVIDPPVAAPPSAIVRLQKRWQFLACAKARSLARGSVAVQALLRSDGDPRIGVGFTATRKIGGAVQRNRAKRRMREAARQLLPLHGVPGHDYVFVARGGVIDRDWRRLLDDVRAALMGLAAGADEPPRPRGPRSPGEVLGGSRSKPNPAKPTAPKPRPPPPTSAPASSR